jgi:hypothetical protein
MVICNFWIDIVKDNKNWLVVLKNSAKRSFLAFGFNEKTILGTRVEMKLDNAALK